MIKPKRKNFSSYILSLVIGISAMCPATSAFDGPTHKYVTDSSLAFINEKFDGYSDFYTPDVIEKLLVYCVKPDEDETDGAFKFHFFNPATERNFMGERESALTRFVNHYRKAVKNYKTCNYDGAWEELGRALHFLEDLNTPVHTNYENMFDAGLKLQMHVGFEKRCIAVQDECKPDVDIKNMSYYLHNSTSTIGKASACLSADNFYSLENNIQPRDTIAKHSVSNAQRAVVGVLYRFYTDVSS